MSNLEKTIAKAFLEMAEGLETGNFGGRPKIALTGMGSEHGEENAMAAAVMAAKRGVDVYYIGSLEAEGVTTVHVADEEEGHKKMDELLASGEVDGGSVDVLEEEATVVPPLEHVETVDSIK